MSGHVFVSYSRVDDVYVRRLATHLRQAGVEVWLDGDDIDDGDRWAQVIAEKVDTCAVFLPVMTPESDRSEWVEREVARAQETQRTIMPVLLSGRPFFRLGATQFEDVTGRRMPDQRFVAKLRELAPGEFEPVPPPRPAPPPSVPHQARPADDPVVRAESARRSWRPAGIIAAVWRRARS